MEDREDDDSRDFDDVENEIRESSDERTSDLSVLQGSRLRETSDLRERAAKLGQKPIAEARILSFVPLKRRVNVIFGPSAKDDRTSHVR